MRISSTIRRSTQVNRLGQAVHFQNRTRNWTEFGARIARLASLRPDVDQGGRNRRWSYRAVQEERDANCRHKCK